MIQNMPVEVKEYFESGSKKAVKVKPLNDYKLIITFNNGVKKRFDMIDKLYGVFSVLKNKEKFDEVFIDADGNIAWDINANVDSEIFWNNRIDMCSDSAYIYSEIVD